MNNQDETAKSAADPIADPKKAEPTKNAQLKDADLDKVAGGLNPQPLPPRCTARPEAGVAVWLSRVETTERPKSSAKTSRQAAVKPAAECKRVDAPKSTELTAVALEMVAGSFRALPPGGKIGYRAISPAPISDWRCSRRRRSFSN